MSRFRCGASWFTVPTMRRAVILALALTVGCTAAAAQEPVNTQPPSSSPIVVRPRPTPPTTTTTTLPVEVEADTVEMPEGLTRTG